MLMTRITAAVWLFFGLIGFGARAQETPSPDKSGYTLFNPTPEEYMREISPDRPDKTEQPVHRGRGALSTGNGFRQLHL